MKKKEKKPKLSLEHMQALAIIANRPEFDSLVELFKLEEQNIVLGSFKINSGDVDIARKKAWMEGRLWELRKVLKSFEEAKKYKEDEK